MFRGVLVTGNWRKDRPSIYIKLISKRKPFNVVRLCDSRPCTII